MDHYFTNNQNLKSEIRTLSYNYKNITIDFLVITEYLVKII